jgi:uncharacterized membrane protein
MEATLLFMLVVLGLIVLVFYIALVVCTLVYVHQVRGHKVNASLERFVQVGMWMAAGFLVLVLLNEVVGRGWSPNMGPAVEEG